MSIRANIMLLNGENKELWFYRHSEGNPAGSFPLLKTFMAKVALGTIRDNGYQASGWLVLLGHYEYQFAGLLGTGMEWKVGSIEPTDSMHGDIEYLYEVNLRAKEINVYAVAFRTQGLTKLGKVSFDEYGWATITGKKLKKELE